MDTHSVAPASAARPSGLDVKAILRPVAAAMIPYTLVVLMATWQGYPGIVCVTPLAWSLALWVGTRTVLQSRSAGPGRPLVEAALAGALVGVVEGALLMAITPRMGGGASPDELGQTIGFALCLGPIGILVGAGVGALGGKLAQRRMPAARR